jgi:hypothetical protein
MSLVTACGRKRELALAPPFVPSFATSVCSGFARLVARSLVGNRCGRTSSSPRICSVARVFVLLASLVSESMRTLFSAATFFGFFPAAVTDGGVSEAIG